jgi:peroxiredoxin
MSSKLSAGDAFPKMTVPKMGGGDLTLGTPSGDMDWQMVVVYRGKHCPICTRYLGELNEVLPDIVKSGVEVVAVSADPLEKAAEQMDKVGPTYPVGYDLSIAQMRELGLYISDPRSPQETDRPFAEPGLFVINAEGNLQVVDIANAPFARPDLKTLANGLGFVRENDYPIRGNHT